MDNSKQDNFFSCQRSRIFLACFLCIGLVNGQLFAQTGQIEVNRVQLMPNLPLPYLMRNWKEVALRYDEQIFSTGATGQFLPLIRLRANGINYPPLEPILLDTYVGSANSGAQAEAINIIPALVGASLMGIDKSNQNGIDWMIKAKDFFNKANGQDVYLNGYSTTSGNDWWYDLMPNVFFYQLYSQYPATTDFSEQFITIADRWLAAVYVMGGATTPWMAAQMNYRAFNLSTMTPNNSGVVEPEAAGAIGWLLYHAFLKTGDKKYLNGAQMSIEYLSSLTSNPSYELQLPYGIFIAARMNAELGTNYDIEKMVNWTFDRGQLRGWGAIVGTWNGSNVSGLIGEANDAGNDYAFALNGFQHAAALVPMVKYDKRFARAAGKWMLNLSNASRFFYSKYLPQSSQDDFAWSSVNDPNSVIAYEGLRENKGGNLLYATGDARQNGWAQTNLGLYGSSSVGYMAALVDTTDVNGILLLDVNKTDFFRPASFPSYLVYNPFAVTKQITLKLGLQTFEIYDAVSETIVKSGATGNTLVDISGDEAMLLVYLPEGSVPLSEDGKLYVGNTIVDYHYGYDFQGRLRIKSLEVVDTLVEFNQVVPIYSEVENASTGTLYNWYVNGTLSSSAATNAFSWTAPSIEGVYTLLLEAVDGAASVSDSIAFQVVDHIPSTPVIAGFVSDKAWYYVGTAAAITCNASNEDGGLLEYNWTIPGGSILSQNNAVLNWSLPSAEGLYVILCEVENADGLKTTASKQILVKKMSTGVSGSFAYYPLDGNVKDYSGNGRDATLENAQPAMDSRGQANKAFTFSSGSDIIYIPATPSLNFQNEVTLSFWVRLDAVTQESFILSHGSWEERWKVSVTPDRKLRWTVKTASSTKDLDSTFPLLLNHFYHFAVTYTPYSMELYVDGVLNTFLSATGLIATTAKAITFGRKDTGTSNYHLRGTLDEVRIYDKALAPDEIETLKSLWNADEITSLQDKHLAVTVYPNPASSTINVRGINEEIISVGLVDLMGRRVMTSYALLEHGDLLQVEVDKSAHGLVVLVIQTDHKSIYLKILIE